MHHRIPETRLHDFAVFQTVRYASLQCTMKFVMLKHDEDDQIIR